MKAVIGWGVIPVCYLPKKIQAKEFSTEFGKKQLEIIRGLERELNIKYEAHEETSGTCEICNI
jgi:hypothetical protein